MSDQHPSSALRELRATARHPLTQSSLVAAVVIVALIGPFDTVDRLSLPLRLVYWAILVVPCYAIGFLCQAWVAGWLGRDRPVRLTAIAGLATGVLVSGYVIAVNWVTFDWIPGPTALPGLVGVIIAVSVVITGFLTLAHRQLATAPAKQAPIAPPPLLDRMPLDKRGPLVALTVEDHYVRVRTTKGEELVLMRLGDAIREVGDTSGAQVHRSHWAAFAQVRVARRDGDRAILTMSHGPDIPVSRANLSKLREAGLLPR